MLWTKPTEMPAAHKTRPFVLSRTLGETSGNQGTKSREASVAPGAGHSTGTTPSSRSGEPGARGGSTAGLLRAVSGPMGRIRPPRARRGPAESREPSPRGLLNGQVSTAGVPREQRSGPGRELTGGSLRVRFLCWLLSLGRPSSQKAARTLYSGVINQTL